MSQPRKLLFVCSHNLQRSITAERLFEGSELYEARSAGTRREARVRVSRELLEWADMVFAMDQEHIAWMRSRFPEALAGKRLVCLQVPDKYGFMAFELIDVLKKRLRLYVELPPQNHQPVTRRSSAAHQRSDASPQ